MNKILNIFIHYSYLALVLIERRNEYNKKYDQ